MGDAIARFRDMALSIRRMCDERHSQPQGRAVKPAAAKRFAKACREHFLEHEKAGMTYPARYVHGLCSLRREAERHPDLPPPGKLDLPLYIEWLPEPFAAKEPSESEIRRACREAVKEAVRWGALFETVEARIKALEAAAGRLPQYAGSERYEDPPEEDFEQHPDFGTGYALPSREQADRDYIARCSEFAEALEALAPFIEEPPVAAGSTSEKTDRSESRGSRGQRGRGGRKKSNRYPADKRQKIIADRNRETRKKKPQPLKQWLTEWATENGMTRTLAKQMYEAEQAAIRRARAR